MIEIPIEWAWPIAWNIGGAWLFFIIWVETFRCQDKYCLLHPIWIYKQFHVNYFGCAIITLIFNLFCPIISILYWLYQLLRFTFTVGRK